MEQEVILRVENLKKYFPIKGGFFSKTIGNVKAVDGVSLEVRKGETLGIVGESGCGKSTTGRAILQLLKPTGGKVYFKDQDLSKLSKKEMRALRPKMQLIFQDPYSSLNPRMTVGQIIGEALIDHKMATKENLREKVLEVMDLCGLAEYQIDRFPHEFSGGQRQRIGIARALAVEPKFILCDEPISALDVSIQAQVANLLIKLQKELGLTYLFIAHDLSMVKHISDRVAVMYLGSMVELAESEVLYSSPKHPYTEALMSAIPIADPDVEESRQRIMLEGDVPSPINTPPGCKFQGRCSKCMDICKKEAPLFKEVEKGHFVACHLYE